MTGEELLTFKNFRRKHKRPSKKDKLITRRR